MYDKEITYKQGLEHTKAECSEWSISGGLSAKYQGAGVSTGISYTKQQSEVVKKMNGTDQKQHIEKKGLVSAKHSVEVVLMQ